MGLTSNESLSMFLLRLFFITSTSKICGKMLFLRGPVVDISEEMMLTWSQTFCSYIGLES